MFQCTLRTRKSSIHKLCLQSTVVSLITSPRLVNTPPHFLPTSQKLPQRTRAHNHRAKSGGNFVALDKFRQVCQSVTFARTCKPG